MNIKFMSAEHKAFFEEKVQKYHIEYDRYRLAAIYVLGLSADCRKNFSHCYDGHCCDYEALKKPWVTHTDAKVLRFAFGLYGARIFTANLYNECVSNQGRIYTSKNVYSKRIRKPTRYCWWLH